MSGADWLALVEYIPSEPMIFTRFYFWGFFLAVLTVDTLVYRRQPWRSAWLFAVSLFFFWKTSGLFVGLLFFSISMDYFLARLSGATEDRTRKRLLLAASVAVNLSVLAYFKYAHFVVDNLNALLGTGFEPVNYLARWANASWGTHFVENKILLPVGISFYTFHCLSYAIDVYRGKLQPVRSLVDFGFYVSFFPQLVAGPIVRAVDFIPQIYQEFRLTRAQFGLALFWILNGLGKKLLIGDYMAVNFIDRVFSDPSRHTGFENLMALFGYSLQVYADFSGYTDVAIGLALLMGFTLKTNFNSPYKALHVGEFWQRWHMSLSSWLRDYLYIPMGGNRTGSLFSWIMLGFIGAALVLLSGSLWTAAGLGLLAGLGGLAARVSPAWRGFITTNINLLLTMLIGGLWHGASWMFVIWGGLNGLGLVAHKSWRRWRPFAPLNTWWSRVVAVLATFTFITFTRIWFRCDSLDKASQVLAQMRDNFGLDVAGEVLWGFRSVFLVMALGLAVHWIPESVKVRYRAAFAALPLWAMGLASAGVVLLIYQTVTAEMVPFIYFQF